MTATADVTLAEVSEKILDATLATYVDGMDALPAGVSFSEFIAKLLQGAALAQIAKNAANNDAEAGELLDSYPLPTTSTVSTDTDSGLQTFTSTYQVTIVSSTDNNTSAPAYI